MERQWVRQQIEVLAIIPLFSRTEFSNYEESILLSIATLNIWHLDSYYLHLVAVIFVGTSSFPKGNLSHLFCSAMQGVYISIVQCLK